MRNNTTYVRTFNAGRPKSGINTARKRSSSNISTNYKMMLELYCINKKEVLASRQLKYQRLHERRSASTTAKPAFSLSAAIVSFFEESLFLLKKPKPQIVMATVAE